MGAKLDYFDSDIYEKEWNDILAEIKANRGQIEQAGFIKARFHVFADFTMTAFPEEEGFSEIVFLGVTDFTEAEFHDGASFSGAKFQTDGRPLSFEGATFLPSPNNVNFSGAEFGRDNSVRAGEWEISIFKEGNYCTLVRRWEGKGKKARLAESLYLDDRNRMGIFTKDLQRILSGWHLPEVYEAAFEKFKVFVKESGNPGQLSFKDSFFGDFDIEKVGIEARKKALVKEREADMLEEDKKLLEEIEAVYISGDKEKKISRSARNRFVNIICRHLSKEEWREALIGNGMTVSFDSTKFWNNGKVGFNFASFANEGSVVFDSAYFANWEWVGFDSALFANGGSVVFGSAYFANWERVDFSSASFVNEKLVDFNSASFTNGEWVEFYSTSFANGGNVDFNFTSFANGGLVNFNYASFVNGRELSFHSSKFNIADFFFFGRVVVFNEGVSFFNSEFGEKVSVHFAQSIFLATGKINFDRARFPEKGSVAFQKCHIKACGGVSFNSAYFRSASFVGGTIGWLEDEVIGDISAKEILEKRGIPVPKHFEDWQKKIGVEKVPVRTNVFDEDTDVSWQNISTESASNLTFRLVAFHRSIFDGITLQQVNFNAPVWAELGGRKILHQERELGPKPTMDELRDLENQYVQLKTNLEKVGHYQHAGDFHYGEREMRLKQIEGASGFDKWAERFLSRRYRCLSGYGERPGNAFWGLLAIFFVFTFSLMAVYFFSFKFHGFSSVLFFENWGGLLTAFREHSIYLITPFSWKKGVEILGCPVESNWYYFVLVVGQVLFYIQLPLLVMTVRRRFKR